MLGISAWFAAIFLLLSLSMFLQDLWRDGGAIAVGGLFCSVAIVMLWRWHGPTARGGVFLQQLALPISAAGQALLVFGINSVDGDWSLARLGFAMLTVGMVMAAASRQALHRFACSMHAATGIAVLAFDAHRGAMLAPLFAVLSAGFWLAIAQPYSSLRRDGLRPLGYAAAMSLLLAVWLVTYDRFWLPMPGNDLVPTSAPLLRPAWLVAAAWLVVVLRLVTRRAQAASLIARVVAVTVALLLAVLLQSAPGVLAALMLLVLGFAAGERTLLGISIAGGLVYLVRYYYQLDLSLIDKAVVLATAGGVLLLLRAGISLLWREDPA